jgi:hypothetical protein
MYSLRNTFSRFNDTLTLTKKPLKDNNIGLIVQKLTTQEKRLFEKESEGQAEVCITTTPLGVHKGPPLSCF